MLRTRPGDGVLVNAVQPERLRFVPALNVSGDEVALLLDAQGEALPGA